jgi:hypothetical protein
MTMACRREISRSRTNGEAEKVLIAIICPQCKMQQDQRCFFFELEHFILSKLEILCDINYHGCLCDICCLEDCIGARNERGGCVPRFFTK